MKFTNEESRFGCDGCGSVYHGANECLEFNAYVVESMIDADLVGLIVEVTAEVME